MLKTTEKGQAIKPINGSGDSQGSTASKASIRVDSDVADKGTKFDQINVESELAGTHTERREPNGTVYFVERRTSEDFALQLLDRAIEPGDDEPEESTIPPILTPGSMSIDEVEVQPIETVVLVHREGNVEDMTPPETTDCVPLATAQSPELDNDSGILLVSQMSLNELKSSDESTDHMNSDHHPITITHLAGTKTLPLKRAHKYDRAQSLTLSPVKTSKSETDLRSMLFEEIKRFRRSDDEEDFTDPPSPVEVNESMPIEALSPTIPEPPTFDQEKYDQMGTIPRPKFRVTTMKRKAPSPPVDKKVSEDNSSSDDTPESTLTKSSPHFATFKDKLEALYSRGPPSTFVKANAPPMNRSQSYHPASTTSMDSPALDRRSTPGETLQFAKVNLRPIDTVHRQKLIFNDVLKAINPDTRPSDHKSNETNNNNN